MARTWRLHIRKLDAVSFVTLVMLILRMIVVSETMLVSFEEAGEVDMMIEEDEVFQIEFDGW